MVLGELLDVPEFRLRLLVDPGNARELVLQRVFTTDQPLPERFLSGGELLLTGLLFHTGAAADSADFVASAVRGGAVAVGAGMDHFGEIPAHFVRACRDARLALFEVPHDVSFGDLTQSFIVAAQHQVKQVHATLDRSRKLLTALADGRALDEIAASVVGATGIGCQVLTAAGKRIAAVGLATTEAHLDVVSATAQTARSFPAAVDTAMTVTPVGPRRNLATAWYLLLGAAPALVSRETWDAFDEFSAIAALVRARYLDADRLADADADAALTDAINGNETLGRGCVVVVRGPDPHTTRTIVRDALVPFPKVTIGVVDGDVLAHLPGSGIDSAANELHRHLGRVAPVLGAPVRIGVSDPAPADGVGGAVRVARLAADVGAGPISLHRASELNSARALLAYVPDRVRQEFVDRVLGPVIAHDEAAGSDLLATVAAYLGTGGSWVRTADELHLHPNSVRYRILRATELTGRDLADTAARVDVALALELIGPPRPGT